MLNKLLKFKAVSLIIGVSALVLFICSSMRHALLQSNAIDLGIFDQVVSLISQGRTPISSFLNFHILGDHATLIFDPLAWGISIQNLTPLVGAIPFIFINFIADYQV